MRVSDGATDKPLKPIKSTATSAVDTIPGSRMRTNSSNGLSLAVKCVGFADDLSDDGEQQNRYSYQCALHREEAARCRPYVKKVCTWLTIDFIQICRVVSDA